MDPKRFLEVARRLLTRSAEEDWRTAANRTYSMGFIAPKSDARLVAAVAPIQSRFP
jgi:hypothetical protein